MRENWTAADLRTVVESQLQHQLATFRDRIGIDGPPTPLPPNAAHYLVLALHELGTNAAKYGALSTDAGRVRLEWRRTVGKDSGHRLELVWSETGGPVLAEPERRGFGLVLLEQLTPRALGGAGELLFGRDGVRWTLSAPITPDATPG